MRKLVLCVVALAYIALPTTVAHAHAGLQKSTPAKGSSVSAPPETVKMSFGEPPTADAQVTITDGCQHDVLESIEVLNQTIEASVLAGQPGTWVVSTNVVSAVDGHNTRAEFSFEVEGTPDCTGAVTPPPATEEAAPDSDENEGPSSLLLIGVATVAIAGIGLVVRAATK
ncbi:MAG TPA: copper resistance protein CopC [Actinomycetota bacterium]|nr:copper resistance protein CopC [Actinomycetota bacterium]